MQQNTITNKIEKYRKLIIFLFFIVYLICGILIYRDFGLTVDDVSQKLLGDQSFDYIFHGNQELLSSRDKDHGPAFELTITYLYKLLDLKSDEQIYYFRHLVGFISFYIGTIFFYLLIKFRFKDWKIGLLGTLFLILSPRIFESSFVNSKDIPFMAFSIIALYTLFKFDEKLRLRDAVIHGAITGYMIAIRPLGLLMVAMTGMIWLIKFVIGIKTQSHHIGRHLVSFGLFLSFTTIFVYLWWPWLWPDPIKNFISSFISLSQYTTWQGLVVYIGKVYEPTQLPWHYTPVWILVTTPLIYSFYFLIGIPLTIRGSLLQKFNLNKFTIRFDLVILCWFFIPLLMVSFLHSALYSGWRHMFFIYPAMLVFTISGMVHFYSLIRNGFISKIPGLIFRVSILISLLGTLTTMVIDHPYESMYFTILAGKNLKSARFRYGMDFYGLCAKEALDYALKDSNQIHIDIYPSQAVVLRSAYLLELDERARISWTGDFNRADYFIGAYTDRREPFIVPDNYKHIYSVERGGVDLCVVYQNRDDH
jgi:hypothetical protein